MATKSSASSQHEKADRFVELHRGEPFVIPNPWDVGSALELQKLGFQALTTTSSGFAWTLGKADGDATVDEVVEHVRVVAAATTVPLAVDLENHHEAIVRVAEAGAVGASIEDWDGERIYPIDEAVERLRAAADAAHSLPHPFVLVGRAENHIHGIDDLDDTIARLQAYGAAGADCLYAPGLRTAEQVRVVCSAVSKPVNVLMYGELTVRDCFDAGAQRVSVGGALTWAARDAFVAAATALR
jgi:2-methylisocitrate lyase-like PEP mutase family enzyme